MKSSWMVLLCLFSGCGSELQPMVGACLRVSKDNLFYYAKIKSINEDAVFLQDLAKPASITILTLDRTRYLLNSGSHLDCGLASKLANQ